MINLCIAGGKSGAGKTSLICGLLPYFTGFGVVKFSIDEHYLGDEPLLVNEQKLLEQPGKDSWRYLHAGAKRIVLFQCRPDQLEKAALLVNRELSELPGLFWEGNRVINFIHPNFIILVVNKKGLKRSAKLILPRVDFLVYNRQEKRDFISRSLLSALRETSKAPLITLNLADFSSFEGERIAEIIKSGLS